MGKKGKFWDDDPIWEEEDPGDAWFDRPIRVFLRIWFIGVGLAALVAIVTLVWLRVRGVL